MNSVKVRLEPHHEFYAPEANVPQHVRVALGFPPLVHQLETYKQLKDNHVVFNSFATGTGKTLAAYLHLLDRPNSHALVIAPTNALISQHAQDLVDFKARSDIPHHIIEVDAARLRELKASRDINRNQDAFFKLLNNPYEFADVLGLNASTKAQGAPIVLVTNPDLFYYALYGLVNRIDRRNLTMAMFTFFDYIVIDEFHYYDARQFCTFLFFIAVSHSLGFFDDADAQRRMAILTATPNDNVLKYFDRLSNKGLRYNLVSPNNGYPMGDKVRTLAAMQVELMPFASRQSADLPEHVSFDMLRDWLEQDMTGAVISDRLADVSVLSQKIRGQFTFEKVTGAVDKHDRPQILKTPLLLATPTVDIGYNFRREDKDRQNIDFLVFIAEYYDEFWQRIGRAGRVLGKDNQGFVSQVQALIPEPASEDDWLEFTELDGATLTHQELKDVTKPLLTAKPFNSTYIASEGIKATLSSFGVLLESLTADEAQLIKDALELVQQVFAPNYSPKTLGQVKAYSFERRSIQESTLRQDDTPPKNLVEMFLLFRKEQATDANIKQLRNLLKNHQEARDIFNNYLSARRAVFQAQTSFRGSGDEINVDVYDPQHFLTNTNTTTRYDLMHLLRYFHLDVYEDGKQFFRESGQPSGESLQVKLHGLLDKKERPFISFRLETKESVEEFEDRYVHRLWAFRGLDLVLTVGESLRHLDLKAQQALRGTFLPMTLFDTSDKKFIHKYLRDFKIFPRDIEVVFSKYSKSQLYIGIVGDIGEQALKYLERNKRWNQHVSSFDIV